MTIVYQIDDLLAENQYSAFFESIPRVHTLLTETERQELLMRILFWHYKEEYASQFKTAIDLIIGEGMKMEFQTGESEPSLLLQVVASAPYIDLFNYFLEKGASLNFVTEALEYLEGEGNPVVQLRPTGRYITCLDFADKFISDFRVRELPPLRREEVHRNAMSGKKDININIGEYLDLYEQAESFPRLLKVVKLRDHIIKLGGKRKAELEGDLQGEMQE